MSAPPKDDRTVSCSCGSVELEAIGAPIVSVVCYCDDCQEGSSQIERYRMHIPFKMPMAGPHTSSTERIALNAQGEPCS